MTRNLHLIHPILVHLPIGLWIASFIFDICFLWTANSGFAQFSYYSMLIGLIAAVPSAGFGLIDYFEIQKKSLPKRLAAIHMILNFGVMTLFLMNVVLRYRLMEQVPTFVTRGQFFLSLFSVFLLTISAYIGGLLVYHYGIGFRPQLRDRDQSQRAA